MIYEKFKTGSESPSEFSVFIEISMNAGPIKYEFDKEQGVLVVDRIMQTTMQYPCNYGFIPQTLSGDGDPVDVLVYTNYPLLPGSIITVKPIGALITEDEKGKDEKILAVPIAKVDPFFANINNYSELPDVFLQKINHFFTYYKALEKEKWIKIDGWYGAECAKQIINDAINRAKLRTCTQS